MAAKILVVDDDKEVMNLVFDLLKMMGYEVLTAADGYGAMAAIRQHKPDLLVLDYNLPAGDGGDVYRALRSLTIGADTPVIFLSAIPKYELLQMLPDDSLVRVLEKPLNADDMKIGLAELLGPKAISAKPPCPPVPPAA
ncbi:MAG TPA: hypothetical protein DEB40_02965 [Elusimicrobia bacterium]|nr:hypothetical protein [Elusimicrobiota bacterium]HBT60692.1 hypothetical protein [Elusimicrobiota bacterium]